MTVLELGTDAAQIGRYRAMRGMLKATTALFGARGARALAVAALIAAIGALPASADDWTGTASNDWFSGSNWLDGSHPTAADNANIDTTTPNATVVNGASGTAKSVFIGNAGTGALSIQGGGSLNDIAGYVGYGAAGTATVTGAGSKWTNSGDFHVGYVPGSNGTLIIEKGGAVSDVTGDVGLLFDSTGAVTVTGAGSSWMNSTDLGIGDLGNGTLIIEKGGTVSDADGYIGRNGGSIGTVVLTGAGSIWTNSGSFVVGRQATGTLTVEDGGAVSDDYGFVGSLAGSNGAATVTGVASTWTNGHALEIGDLGNGTLTISAGGAVSDTIGDIAVGFGSTGKATVAGIGSKWTNTGDFIVGDLGTGTLTIEDGGAVGNANGYIAYKLGSTGTATVTGAGSKWANGDLYVGNEGIGTLIIADGGTVSDASSIIGLKAGSAGTVTVTGVGSKWTHSGFLPSLYVGVVGTGTLTVENGGAVSDGFGLIGGVAGSKGTVTVTGAGSTWTNGFPLAVGDGGTGALTVADGGAVKAPEIVVAAAVGSQGTLNIGAAAGDPPAVPGILDTPKLTFGAGTGTLIFDHTSNAYAFAPVISGKGAIEAVSGTTLLSGASGGFTGITTVHGGATLGIDGTLGGTLDVLSGGRLEGTGTAGTVTVSGIVAPGHSIGTLHIAGAYTQAPGSTYRAEIDSAGHSDLIDVAGKATLNGGTVEVVPFPDFAIATPYNVLTAAGGVSGTFAGASAPAISAFLAPTLTYDANAVFLTINQTASFASAALTPNQKAAAAGADSAGPGNPVWDAIALLPSASDAPAAFDAISGEVHANVQSVLIDGSRYFREVMLGRLRQAAYANAGGQMAALGIGGPDIVYAYAGQRPRSAAMPVKALPMKAPQPAAEYGITYWAQGLGAWGHIDSDGNAASVDDNHAGFFTGFDVRFGTWRAGLAAGYTHADADIDARASSANVDTAHIGAYAGTKFGALNLRGGAAFAWHSIDTNRTIAFPGFFDQAKASYTGNTAQVFGEVGYGMQFGTIAAEPFAGLAYVHLETNGFNETGGASALSGGGASDDVGYSSLGIRAATRMTLSNGKALVPHVSVAWQHAFGDVTPAVALAFASTGTAFTISGVPLARDAALVQAGLDYLLTANATLSLSYSGELAGNLQDHAVKGDFTWRF